MSPSDSPDHPGSILYHCIQNLQRSPIPQTSNWLGTFFFAVSYSKPALEVILCFKPDFLPYEQILHVCAYFVVGGKHW